ncbi:hypothetical protein TNIN_342221 [Trichonephila inaurata madagascariensis]|uniref:Uncharacterized protein n=1 Tax=Trichonephila inaurata madagascariensis TaxID=2747483 RepID=A0A8X6YJI3_9ARAC|nr:hypothetical protein TNIN_342221 [Trichonephila inaurata madagascariensis]
MPILRSGLPFTINKSVFVSSYQACWVMGLPTICCVNGENTIRMMGWHIVSGGRMPLLSRTSMTLLTFLLWGDDRGGHDEVISTLAFSNEDI